MTLRASYISWVLVAVLSIVVIYEVIGANRTEQRAAQAEAVAKDVGAQLQRFEADSKQREALAESRYQASLQESANLRLILAKGSERKALIPPQSLQDALRQPQDAAKPDTPSQAAQASCQPFIYKGDVLVIESFQVSTCDGQPMVQAEAAIGYRDEKALVDKLQTQVADMTAKDVLMEKDLAAYKVAEQSWKKAAKKSRIKRILGVGEKVALFVGGIYLGRIAH